MDEGLYLYIPTGVKAENELFDGFGKTELIQSICGALFGGAVAAVLWIISSNVALTVVAVLTGIFGSVMMCTKDQNNQSVVDQVRNLFCFWHSQQIYPYRMLEIGVIWRCMGLPIVHMPGMLQKIHAKYAGQRRENAVKETNAKGNGMPRILSKSQLQRYQELKSGLSDFLARIIPRKQLSRRLSRLPGDKGLRPKTSG